MVERGPSFGMNEAVKHIIKRCRHSRGPRDTPVSGMGGVGVCLCVYSFVSA